MISRYLPENFVPKSILSLRGYSKHAFISDFVAGITVGLVALPLAMAFAISSGVSPESGIYCAIVAGFLISALGGSKTQIGGPTGAFVVVVAGIVQEHGIDGLFMCTMMAGVILIVLGISGLGSTVRYIPRPVVIGFTNGIAVLIASTQLKDLFGLTIDKVPGDFVGRINAVAHHFDTWSGAATALGFASILLILIFRRFVPKIPGSIVALVVGTIAASALGLQIDTIESRFGGIPRGLPHFSIPTFRPDLILTLLSPTITVAMLGAIESLLSAVVADKLSGDKHNPNVELFAQGVANVLSPLAGGLPATGAIARTATNIRSGATTPVAGMMHAVTLLLILLVAAPLAGKIPLCVLSAILMIVAYNMGEWREIPHILRLRTASIVVWSITFFLTVFADLTVAVEAGMAMAALLFIRKVTNTTTVIEVTPDTAREDAEHSLHLHPLPEGTALFKIHGPFLFGATEKLDLIYEKIDSLPPVVLLRVRNMSALDATGLHALEALADALKHRGKTLVVCGLRDQPERMLTHGGFPKRFGEENICRTLRDGIERARVLLQRART